jgi:NAD(P)-dependent dehydrogenase (short-subunit alcohol dehydrogenase family)
VADLDLPSATKVAAEASALAAARNPSFRATPFKVDVTSEDSVNRLMACVRATSGRLDYCVNCAGIGVERAAPIAEASLAEFNRFLDVNVSGTFLVTRAASSMMAAQEPIKDSPLPVRGAIVNMGSAASFVSTPQMVQYTTSKHAILGLTKNSGMK